MKLKRDDVIPGITLRVRSNHNLNLDMYLFDFGKARLATAHTVIKILSKPRKKENINLVKIELNDGKTYECFYCDVLKNCELIF